MRLFSFSSPTERHRAVVELLRNINYGFEKETQVTVFLFLSKMSWIGCKWTVCDFLIEEAYVR